MTDYKQLAIRYLKYNKKRTGITILGVALSTMILFAFLNSMLSLYVTKRNEAMELAGKEITTKYGVESLVEEFFKEGSPVIVSFLTVLLIAYIFAIFGVAVVRNSIQLISLEQIKDYGVLRCIGSTKNQLRETVYLMGFLLEISGIVLGIGLGFLLYLPIALKTGLEIGFHVIVIPFIVLVFLFDLYFVMQENCRFVNRLTPVEAVRGEFKINKNKLKVRGKSLAGVLFGIEGDYASKSLKRNPARFWKCVGAMSMGTAMVVVTVSLYGIIHNFLTLETDEYGKYQVSDVSVWEPGVGNYEEELFDKEIIGVLQNSNQVVQYKNIYETYMYTPNCFEVINHLTEEYANGTDYGQWLRESEKFYLENDALQEVARINYKMFFARNRLLGYDEEDYQDLKSELIAGTLDVSEKGIVLVNETRVLQENAETLNAVWTGYTITDYQVGDVIEFVDFKKYDALIKEKLQETDLTEGEEWYSASFKIMHECYERLVQEGATKTYIIEGILQGDCNRGSNMDLGYGDIKFILPLDRYYEETGLTENMTSGQMYCLEGYRLSEELKKVYHSLDKQGMYYKVKYLELIIALENIWDIVIAAMLFVLFVVIVNLLNIVNTTSSDLHLRRKEFAQLRVLGMSKKKLYFTVLLEGVITSVLSSVIGIGLGYIIIKTAIDFVNRGYYVPFHFSWLVCGIMFFVSIFISCMTMYMLIRNMKISMAEELQVGGE